MKQTLAAIASILRAIIDFIEKAMSVRAAASQPERSPDVTLRPRTRTARNRRRAQARSWRAPEPRSGVDLHCRAFSHECIRNSAGQCTDEAWRRPCTPPARLRARASVREGNRETDSGELGGATNKK